MNARVIALLLAGVGLAAAGCVSPAGDVNAASADSPAAADDWWHINYGEDHDHSDWSHHEGKTTPNFQELGWDPLTTARYGSTATGMGCGGTGVTPEGRKLAVVHTISTEVAFAVADITDPANPMMLGEYLLPNAVVWDATITPDGLHALIGAYPPIFGGRGVVLPPTDMTDAINAQRMADAQVSGETWQVQPMWRDACTGIAVPAGPEQYLPMGPGIVMVGLQNPESPEFEDWVSQPVIGPHSVSSQLIDGTVYAISSVTNLAHDASYYSFFQIIGPKLVPFAVLESQSEGPVRGGADNGHTEAELGIHPVTGQLLAYTADWNEGAGIWDLSIPAAPQLIGTFKDGNTGGMHSLLPSQEMWGDRHITIVGTETGEPVDLPSGIIYILDTTDPTNPVELSRWTLPFKPVWDGGGLQFSTHYMFMDGHDTMFVSNYHGGLWAVDLTDLTHPETIGRFVPTNVPETTYGGGSFGPGIEDVVVDPETHVVTTWDNSGGIYQLSFDRSIVLEDIPEWGEGSTLPGGE